MLSLVNRRKHCGIVCHLTEMLTKAFIISKKVRYTQTKQSASLAKPSQAKPNE